MESWAGREPRLAEEPVYDQQADEECSWVRPAFHVSGCKAAVYNKLKLMRQLFGGIKHSMPLVRQFRDSCFGRFYDMQLDDGEFPNTAIHAILGRQITFPNARKNELWFKVGSRKIRFSRNEFALVTGLRFGPNSFDTTIAYETPPDGLFSCYFTSEDGKSPLICDVLHQFNCGRFRSIADGDRDHFKVMKILFVYLVILGADELKKRVDKWVWTLIEDEDGWESFPWGTFAFQALIQHISCVRTSAGKQKYHVYGCTLALLFWSFEAIPRLGYKCAKLNTNPSSQVPRILKWELKKRVTFTELKYVFVEQSECVPMLEITSEEQEAYRDWWSCVEQEDAPIKKLGTRSRKKACIAPPPRERRRIVKSGVCNTMIEVEPVVEDMVRVEPFTEETTTDVPIRRKKARITPLPRERQRRVQSGVFETMIEVEPIIEDMVRVAPSTGETTIVEPSTRETMIDVLIRKDATMEETDRVEIYREVPIVGETNLTDVTTMREIVMKGVTVHSPMIEEQSTVGPEARDPLKTSIIESIAPLRRENTDNIAALQKENTESIASFRRENTENIAALRKDISAMVQVEVDKCFSVVQQRIPKVVEDAVSTGLESKIPGISSSVRDVIFPEIRDYLRYSLCCVVSELKETIHAGQTPMQTTNITPLPQPLSHGQAGISILASASQMQSENHITPQSQPQPMSQVQDDTTSEGDATYGLA